MPELARKALAGMRVEEKQRVEVRRRRSPAAGRDSITDVPSEAQRVYRSRCARKGVRQAMRARTDDPGRASGRESLRHDRYRPQNRKAPTEPPARRTARRRPGQCRRDRRRSEIKAFRRKTESIQQSPAASAAGLCVGTTYFPGQSPGKYFRRIRA